LAPGSLAGKYFFNLDSEEENQLCIGCAGGVNTVARRYLTLAPAPAGRAFRLRVTGLQGGHSGIDIHKGRGNAIRLLARVLHAAIEDCGVAVAGLNGGSKRNAIPREAAALVVVDPPRERALRELLAACQAVFRSELGAFDPQVELSLEATAAPAEVIAPAEAALVANLLAAQHHGVLAMSPDVAGLVQTSTNLAIVATNGAEIVVETSQRSPIEASKAAAAGMVSTVFHQAGFATEQNASYPGWKPEPHSDIVRLAVAVHKELLGIEPELVAIHAGLECGVIGEKHPGMQMISFGPRLTDVHSPSERVKISTVPPFWKYLTGLLERV
jgi:dipeptidase D